MPNFLKGNYKVDVKIDDKDQKESYEDKYKKTALNSIGGSMVFVERDKLTWDGEDIKKDNDKKQS